MPRLRPFVHLLSVALCLFGSSRVAIPVAHAQEASSPDAAPPMHPSSTAPQPTSQTSQSPAPITRAQPEPLSHYDRSLFEKPFASAQLSFLNSVSGVSSGELFRDKQFRRLMKGFVPDCMFHYGRDMPLADALHMALSNSRDPVSVRDGRYVTLSGARGPYLAGRAFLWVDLQDGVGIGAFFFTPTNGEPTPTLAVFSRQVKADTLALSDMPPAFAQDLAAWTLSSNVPEITTRYFLTGTNKRILLEHDEDFCVLSNGTAAGPGSGCEELNAHAADLDETAAYYLVQVHYATNATAWMIGPDQTAWIQLRNRSCLGIPDSLGCRIRVTREHTHLLIHRLPPPRIPHR